MSLALEAQGETVPKRGDTHQATSLARGVGGAETVAPSKRTMRWVSVGDSGLTVPTKNTSLAVKPLIEGAVCCKVCSKRWVLKGLKASPPWKVQI